MAYQLSTDQAESVEDSLKRRKENLEAALADINAALAVLAENPKTLELLNTLRRVGI